jgi:hypothetical protein
MCTDVDAALGHTALAKQLREHLELPAGVDRITLLGAVFERRELVRILAEADEVAFAPAGFAEAVDGLVFMADLRRVALRWGATCSLHFRERPPAGRHRRRFVALPLLKDLDLPPFTRARAFC